MTASWPGARGIVPRRFVALVPIPERRMEPLCKGRKAGRSNPASAPVLAPGRRSGCSSAEPYPPPRPIVIVGRPLLGANHPLIRSYMLRSSTFGGTSAARSRLSEATDLSCHLSQVSFAPHEERPKKYRGARTERSVKSPIWPIRRSRFGATRPRQTGSSYPIASVPGRPSENSASQ